MSNPNMHPEWMGENGLDDVKFCKDFLSRHKVISYDGEFFTPEGRMSNDLDLRRAVFEELKEESVRNLPARISTILEVMRLAAAVADFPPQPDRIHFRNGTLYLDGTFQEGKEEVVQSRLAVNYNPAAPRPERWLAFLQDLLYPEDIPTLQEFMGYCLIPSNKGQRMMVIKGKGGEGKSLIGAVMRCLMGSCMKDGSIGKVSENPFARADLEHVLLMVDDDMRMEALRQTNYVKSIVTAQGKMDLERKGRQSYQGWLYARLLGFSNGDLQALYDRSDGFYRRQLVLEARDKPRWREDDPFLAERLGRESEGIALWALEGLQRLIQNNFCFTESGRVTQNRESARRSGSNLYDFLEAEDYIRLNQNAVISSRDLYELYQDWCQDNALLPLKSRSVSEFLMSNLSKYQLEHTNNIYNHQGRRVWGFRGLERVRPSVWR